MPRCRRAPVGRGGDVPAALHHAACGHDQGGTAHNITAADCRFAVEMRVVPDEDLEAMPRQSFWPRPRGWTAGAQGASGPRRGCIWTRWFFGVPRFAPNRRRGRGAGAQLTGANGSGVVSYGTEAGQFQEAGYSAVVCGPGDIAQAHQPDEYLELSEWKAGIAFMERLRLAALA
jgi:acetylornithine deacetylase